MILIFLIALIVTLILANVLVSFLEPKKTEKGFANIPDFEELETNDHIENLKENTYLLQGALQATNKKLDLLTNRVTTVEKVLMALTEEKISKQIRKQITTNEEE